MPSHCTTGDKAIEAMLGFDDYKNNYYIIFISNSVEYYTQMEI